jgi:hypothetical protein
MKRSILIATFTTAAFFIATTPALAQHGRPSSPGAPAGSMGGTHGDASSHSGSGSGNAGTNAGAKSPDQLLNNNSHLSANLQKLLPTGTTPQQVCANFTNLGKCVAAIHVSHNLGIDLNSLVCDMTLKPIGTATCPAGTATGSKGMSLGSSIAALDPNVNSKSESKKANQQAKQDVNGSGS